METRVITRLHTPQHSKPEICRSSALNRISLAWIGWTGSSPVAKGGLKRQSSLHQGLILRLSDRLLQSVAPKSMADASEEDWSQMMCQLLGPGSQCLHGALRSLSWTANGAAEALNRSDSQAGQQPVWTGALAAAAAPVVAACAVLLAKLKPTGRDTTSQVLEVHALLTQLGESCARAVLPIGVNSETATPLMELATLCILQ
eukprot:scaffold266205_cov50-Prasinocladus_malaysianus.AAC.1